jgi:hypothetical protein
MKSSAKNKKKTGAIRKIQKANQKGMDAYKKSVKKTQPYESVFTDTIPERNSKIRRFAKKMAQFIFEIGIERDSTYVDFHGDTPYDFIWKMVDVKKHATAIKKRIEEAVFKEVVADYDSFIDETTGELSNQNDLEDYANVITDYCVEQYEAKQKKKEKSKNPTHVVVPIEYFKKKIGELNERIKAADYFGGTTDKVVKNTLENVIKAGKKITIESDDLNISDKIEVVNK